MSNEAPNEFRLDTAPTDLVSAVQFSPACDQFLLVSSWDGTVRVYDVTNNMMRSRYKSRGPVFDCCFQDSTRAWCAGLDCEVKLLDLNTPSLDTLIGKHDSPVRCIEYCPKLNVVVTGSWDRTTKLWDPRANDSSGTFLMGDKVYTLAVCGEKIIVGTAGRKVLVYDLRNMAYAEQRRESCLKYQTRCIRAFPNEVGYVLSSIEGRVAVEYLDPDSEVQKKRYAFKCHRVKENNGVELIYPVNAIAFHAGYNTFATGGCDGFVNIWDGFNKKRLCQFHRYPTHISALAFSAEGSRIAIASSFIFEEEVADVPTDSVFIRTVTDQETKPK